MTKSTITREHLQEMLEWCEIFRRHPRLDDIAEAIRMALAAIDSEPVAEITEDLGRLFVKIHYPTTLRAGDKLYLHAQTATASEPVLWAWQHLDMWHVTSHHGRARDLGLSGFKVIPLYLHARPGPVVLKDHKIRELVNQLRDIAIEYHGTQQLRERIARVLRSAMLNGGKP